MEQITALPGEHACARCYRAARARRGGAGRGGGEAAAVLRAGRSGEERRGGGEEKNEKRKRERISGLASANGGVMRSRRGENALPRHDDTIRAN